MIESLVKLSGSTSGKSIKIAATATAGTTLHTAVSGTTTFDMIHLWISNTDTSDRTVTIEFGGVTDPDNLINKAFTIPAKTMKKVLEGQLLNGGLTLAAFASSANVLLATGYVLRVANS